MKKLLSLVLALALAVALAACGGSKTGGDGSGAAQGDGAQHTTFFDYAVNDAYLCDSFETYTPAEGNEMLVVEVSVTNTFGESIEMYDLDFQAQWSGEGDEDYAWPITFDGTETGTQTLRDDQLPAVYQLADGETRTGLLVYEVPAGESEFSVSYMEYFDDDSTGDTYFIYFGAEKRQDSAAA